MKRIYISLIALAVSTVAFSQSKIKLDNGQKIVVENNTDVSASLAMGMEVSSNSNTVNALQVKNSTADNYTISNTLTKIKMTSNMMGQASNYDSDNKTGNDEQLAKVFDDKLNKQVDITIDNKTGDAIGEQKKTKADEDAANAAADLMKMFSDNASDDAVVSSAFEIIPKGKSVGDSWADTTTAKDMKTIRTFTLQSVTGNEAVIALTMVATATNTLNFQEMEFNIKSTTKSTGEIITDITTSLVKKRTGVADITGSIQIMGQDMPITAKVTTINIYK